MRELFVGYEPGPLDVTKIKADNTLPKAPLRGQIYDEFSITRFDLWKGLI
jgi:hypothetical protein